MARLHKRIRRLGLALALGLGALAAITTPLLSNELAHILPHSGEILIAQSENGGG